MRINNLHNCYETKLYSKIKLKRYKSVRKVNKKGIIVDRNNSMELKFSLLFLERDLIFFFALGTNFFLFVYLLLNWTEKRPRSPTIFAELTRPYTRILNQSKAQMQPDFQTSRQAILCCAWRFLQHREQSCTAPTISLEYLNLLQL